MHEYFPPTLVLPVLLSENYMLRLIVWKGLGLLGPWRQSPVGKVCRDTRTTRRFSVWMVCGESYIKPPISLDGSHPLLVSLPHLLATNYGHFAKSCPSLLHFTNSVVMYVQLQLSISLF